MSKVNDIRLEIETIVGWPLASGLGLRDVFRICYRLAELFWKQQRTEVSEDDTVEAIRRKAKWENNDYIYRGHILNGMSDPLFDINQNVESTKALLDSLKSKYMAEDASSKKFLVSNINNYKMVESREQESDKGKGKEVVGPSVNMMEESGKNKNKKQNKEKKHGFKDNNGGSSSNKKPKLECWKCGKTGHFKKD
nr:Gag-Pol polymerase [Tanacetum cinerariifolium]